MTKTLVSALAFAVALSTAGAAMAQASGGADAKGNAPLKPAHTVNDGAAKRGANSFTQKQAQEHIEKSGFTGVSNLVKGDDGVWRGKAMRGGSSVDVAMDFKGNVSTPSAPAVSREMTSTTRSQPAVSETRTNETTTTTAAAAAGHTRHHRRHHHHRAVACANPAPDGAACSGVDRNRNGVSDKEDRAIRGGAHP